MSVEKLTIDDFISFEDSPETEAKTISLFEEPSKETPGEELETFETEETDDFELLAELPEISFEEDFESEFETIENKDDKPKGNSSSKSSSKFEAFNLLKERGILELDREPENEQEALELVEEAWENSFSTYVDDMVADLPEEAKGLLKFVKEGGDPYEYLRTLKDNATFSVNKKSDISQTNVQEQVMRLSLEKQGYDADYIEDHIETLKETGKLEKYSKPIFDRIVEEQVKQEKEAVNKVAESRKARTESLKREKQEIQDYLVSTKEVKGFTLSEADKRDLASYMKEPVVQLQDGTSVTAFQKELFEAAQDKETGVLLAKLLKNKFNFDNIKKKAVSQKTEEIDKGLKNVKTQRQSKSLFDRL
jgi:hypothetical protein